MRISHHRQKTPLVLDWCHDASHEPAITALFLQQLSPAYISHGELQEERAVAVGEWRRDLPEVVRRQVQEALAQDPATACSLVATARSPGERQALAGIAFVTIDQAARAARRFAMLDDLVVDPAWQGHGVGEQLFDWVCAELQQRGVQRVFLESGIDNERAHRFFKARGCETVSVTLLKELGPSV